MLHMPKATYFFTCQDTNIAIHLHSRPLRNVHICWYVNLGNTADTWTWAIQDTIWFVSFDGWRVQYVESLERWAHRSRSSFMHIFSNKNITQIGIYKALLFFSFASDCIRKPSHHWFSVNKTSTTQLSRQSSSTCSKPIEKNCKADATTDL